MPRESEIIAHIRSRAKPHRQVLVGIGDDAAVLDFHPDDLIACSDLSVENVHFRLEWTSARLIGHKALAVTLSDVAAMGGAAQFAMVSIGLPQDLDARFVDELFSGIFDLAESSEVAIIGGDTSSSPGPLFIDTVAIGKCAKGRALTRSGAQAGDRVFVTGSLGASMLGLKLLDQGYRFDDKAFSAAGVAESVSRRQAMLKHLAPEPLLKLGRRIGEAEFANSMIDVSDGLTTDLWHILEESRCGAIIRASAIPIAECVLSLGVEDPLRVALESGEEYELVFTARPEDRAQMLDLSKELGVRITEIGEIVTDYGLKLERDGEVIALDPTGFEHLI